MRTKFLHLVIGFVALTATACGGSLTGIAENVLYPFESVNKDYPVPEIPPAGLHQVYLDVKANDGKDMKIHAWYHKNPSASRAIVYFHGNGLNIQAMYQVGKFEALKSLGVSVIAIDYPGLGRSTGTPNEFNLTHAGMASVKWAEQNFANQKIYVWGRSLGAAVAAQVSSRMQDEIHGLVLLSGWNNFLDVAKDKTGMADGLPESWIKMHRYDSAAAVSGFRKKALQFHGDADTLIAYKFGVKLAEAFPDGNATFVTMPGYGHNDVFQDRTMWAKVKSFLFE